MRQINTFVCIFAIQLIALASTVSAQDTTTVKKPTVKEMPSPLPTTKKWYEQISLRGYTQVRYNRLLETNPNLRCEQCDRSWGDNTGFGIRRLRMIFFGNVHERVYIYIQPDFASAVSTTAQNFAQIRDAYFDLSLDKKKEFRFRVGQSKVPYGFENMQSSQNRTPLDRNDALNSAVANERDLGTFFYWAPQKIRERFSYLVSSGLKGSGDYGVFAFGLYNGTTANRAETNNNLHMVTRLTYPFKLKSGQIIEPGIQAYRGKVNVAVTNAEVKGTSKFLYDDERIAGTLRVYPQPIGFTAEYNIGTGPEYNPATNSVEQKPLKGGYAQIEYMLKKGQHLFLPFVRYQYYNGGKKHEVDARMHRVRETEIGIEWQPFKNFELVAMYTISDRTFQDAAKPVNQQSGSLLRLQAQFNY
jgi:phosphate-selective porin